MSFLDVVDAQSVTLNAQRRSEQVRTRRLEASIELVRALGGGWSKADLSPSIGPTS